MVTTSTSTMTFCYFCCRGVLLSFKVHVNLGEAFHPKDSHIVVSFLGMLDGAQVLMVSMFMCKNGTKLIGKPNKTKHQSNQISICQLARKSSIFFLLFLLCGLEPVTRTAIILGTLIFGNLSPGAPGCEFFQVTSGGGLWDLNADWKTRDLLQQPVPKNTTECHLLGGMEE